MSEVRTTIGRIDGAGLRVAIVAARFNEAVVERLVHGAIDALQRHGTMDADIHLVWVPGAFELPVVLQRLASSGGYDGIVALGAVVRGETPHFDYVAGAATTGIASTVERTGVPIGNGVLTTDTWEQAVERAGGKAGNKGAEAALTVIEMVNVLKEL